VQIGVSETAAEHADSRDSSFAGGLRVVRHIANAGFDKRALSEAKGVEVSLPEDTVFGSALPHFFQSTARPETIARTAALLKAGLQTRSDIELDLGKHVGAPFIDA
jgi:hypothetical protein